MSAEKGMTKDTRAIIVAIVMAAIAIVGIGKADIAGLRSEMKADNAELRAQMKADIAELRAEVKADIAELRAEVRELRGLLFSHTAAHSHAPETAKSGE